MKKLIIITLAFTSIGAFADQLICMGNTNNNQLIQLNVELDKRLGNVQIENQKYELTVSNDFMHVWQNSIDGQAYTNSLSRIDGSLTVIAENVLVNNQRQPVIRAVLSCKDKKDLLF